MLEEKISLLKAYFSGRPEIAMAFAFGSRVTGAETAESDFDVAVYFSPEGKALEWEEAKYYPNEDEIWGDVERIAGLKTDLVVLNRAPSTLAFAAIQSGVPIVVKDHALFLRFFLAISSAAEYLREFARDFWAIKQRSASLTDIDRDRLIRIIDFMESEMADYPGFADIDRKTYESDTAVRRNVERWTENIVNSSIDMAKIILASEKKRIPQTYREILEELSLVEGFNSKAAERLARFSKLRNILAHEYLDVRFEQIRIFIGNSEEAYREMVSFARKFASL